jgi:hypothetical protein
MADEGNNADPDKYIYARCVEMDRPGVKKGSGLLVLSEHPEMHLQMPLGDCSKCHRGRPTHHVDSSRSQPTLHVPRLFEGTYAYELEKRMRELDHVKARKQHYKAEYLAAKEETAKETKRTSPVEDLLKEERDRREEVEREMEMRELEMEKVQDEVNKLKGDLEEVEDELQGEKRRNKELEHALQEVTTSLQKMDVRNKAAKDTLAESDKDCASQGQEDRVPEARIGQGEGPIGCQGRDHQVSSSQQGAWGRKSRRGPASEPDAHFVFMLDPSPFLTNFSPQTFIFFFSLFTPDEF